MLKKLGFLILSLGFAISGCGERLESTRYYYSPSWTREGKIIFIGALQTVGKDILGSQLSSSYSEYVKTVYPSGTGESSVLFDVTGAPPYSMSCSPSRDYVAYMDDLRSGLFGRIVIRNISTGEHTGMEKFELLFSENIKSFDWSADGNKIAYCTTREVRVRDWNDFLGLTDTSVTAESSLEFVSWKYGARIAFIYSSGGDKLLSLIYPDGSNRTYVAANYAVDKPQVSPTSTGEVYGFIGTSYGKVNTGLPTPVTSEVKTSFTGILPRLSRDGKSVVYSKSGESSGVYILDVATGVETPVK